MEQQKQTVSLLGLPIVRETPEQILDKMDLFLEQEKMNTISLLTIPALLEAAESPLALQKLSEADFLLPAEAELFALIGAGDGRTYAEDALYLLFSRFTEMRFSILLLDDTQEEAEQTKKVLLDRYPELNIPICAGVSELEETGADSLLNEMNSMEIEIVITSLFGNQADLFMSEHRSKINPKIWINLGRHRKLQTEAGIKTSKMKTLTTSMNWSSFVRTQLGK